jgi:neutral ceramidase
VAFGSVDVPEHVVCRRYFMKAGYKAPNPVTGKEDLVKTNPFGDEDQIDRPVAPMDTQVSFLAVKGLDERWISLLGNYSLHYVGDWENGTISADYFGVFSEEIGRLLGADSDFVGIMSNGTSGDANIWDFLNPGRYPSAPFAKSRLIGTDIAERVYQKLPGCIWQTSPDLAVSYDEFPVNTRKPTVEELENASKIVAEADYENLKKLDNLGLTKLYAREQIMLNELPDILLLPIHLLKIGNGLIGGLGGEFFAETGLRLKRNSRAKNYFTIGLANGGVGYVPPVHEFLLGGYETWRCRTSFLDFDAEQLITNRLLEMQSAFL